MSNLPTYTVPTGDSGINCEDDCNCPGCSPAGDLFMPPSEVNPRRRIIRARRPPQSDPNNLPSAIGFLQQANNNHPSSTATATRGGGMQRSGEVSDSDDESMPPLEDIDNTAANPATSSTARQGRNNGSSNRTGNRFGALGEY